MPQPVEIGRGEPPFLVRAAPPPAGAAAGRIDQYTGEAFGRACEPVRPALAEYLPLDDGDASPPQARRRPVESRRPAAAGEDAAAIRHRPRQPQAIGRPSGRARVGPSVDIWGGAVSCKKKEVRKIDTKNN